MSSIDLSSDTNNCNSVSWHQCLRKVVTGLADMIVDSVIPRGNHVSTYARLIVAFGISGLLHHSGDMAMGVPIREAGSVIFFVSQSLGIMFEDAVRGLY